MASAGTIVRVHDLPWNGLGADVSDATSVDQIVAKAGLDWQVEQVPAFAGWGEGSLREIPNRQAIVRTDTGDPLGVAGNYFHPIQNDEATSLIEDLLTGGHVQPIRAGSIKGGQQTFFAGRLGDGWNVGGIDPMDTFFLLTNRHDGRGGLQAGVMVIRRGCSNELPGIVGGITTGAIHRRRNADRIFRWAVRHTTNVGPRITLTREAIQNAALAQQVIAKQATTLLLRPFTTDDMAKVAERLFPTKGETVGPRTITKNMTRQGELIAVYRGSENLEDVRDTAWGGWNAIAEYADHALGFRASKVSTKAESRFLSIVDPHGSAHVLKEKGFAAVVQTVGAASAN